MSAQDREALIDSSSSSSPIVNFLFKNFSLPPKTACFAVKAGFIASIGGLLFGYDLGVIAGALDQLDDKFDLSDFEKELVVSILLAGATIGSLIGGFLCDKIGRLLTIYLTCVIFLIGAFLLLIANSLTMIYIGRFVVGVGVAVSAIADVTYLTEVSPLQWRGNIVSCNELAITIGILVAFAVDFIFQDTDDGWRIMFGISGIFAAIQMLGMFFGGMPESPRWLLLVKNDRDKAHEILRSIYETERDVQDEIMRYLEGISSIFSAQSPTNNSQDETNNEEGDYDRNSSVQSSSSSLQLGTTSIDERSISDTSQKQNNDNNSFSNRSFDSEFISRSITTNNNSPSSVDSNPYQDSFRSSYMSMNDVKGQLSLFQYLWKYWRPQFLISLALMFFQQFSGNTAILSYAPYIFDKDPYLSTLILGIVKVVVTILVVWKVEDGDIGRRDWLLWGVGGMIFGCLVLATPLLEVHAVALIACSIFIGSYSFSFGPLSWLVVSELFEANIRGRAIGIATTVNWFCNFLVSISFLTLLDVSPILLFSLYGGICVFGIWFIYYYVPETKGKEPREIYLDIVSRFSQANVTCSCCLYDQQQVGRVEKVEEKSDERNEEEEKIGSFNSTNDNKSTDINIPQDNDSTFTSI